MSAEYGRYRVIGDKGCRLFMCLDEEMAGRIVYVNRSRPKKIKVFFGNSSYHQLVAFWTARRHHGELIENASDEDKDHQITLYEKALRRIDPAALVVGAGWAGEIAGLREFPYFM